MRKMYSKGQLIDVVNQGIANGQIGVGTKLYRHVLTAQIGANTKSLDIISLSPTKIDSLTTLSSEIANNNILSSSFGTSRNYLASLGVTNVISYRMAQTGPSSYGIYGETVVSIDDDDIVTLI